MSVMPKSVDREIARRGGALRWRSVKMPDGRTATYAITRSAGPRGGRAVLVKIKRSGKGQ